jgi:hypothetical protein
MGIVSVILCMLATMTLTGVVLMWLGIRGRRLGDHPFCRKCEFDLFGRPDDAERRCPECGADLSARRAVVTGARRRRPAIAACGAALLLLSLAAPAAWLWGNHKRIDWQALKPGGVADMGGEASRSRRPNERACRTRAPLEGRLIVEIADRGAC